MQWFKEAIGSKSGLLSWCNKLKVVLDIFICEIWLLGVFDRNGKLF